MNQLRRIASTFAAATLAATLAGCSSNLPNPDITPVDFRGCILSDLNGFTDGGANEAAYNGMLEAKAVLGIQLSATDLSGKRSPQAITQTFDKFVRADCDLIVAVGDAVVGPLYVSASEHSDQRYLLVDAPLTNSDGSPRQLDNVRSLTFDNWNAGFIAGYLAADKTESDRIGVVVGRLSPTVLDYVGGFKKGVQYFNRTQSGQAVVIGAEGDSGDNWTRVGGFDSLGKAQSLTQSLIDMHADVIFAAAGRGAIGALRAAAATVPGDGGIPVSVINAENDSFIDPLYRQVRGSLLASITRSTMRQVFETARDALNGSFVGADGSYVGDLANDGVGLSPEHDVAWPGQADLRISRLKEQILQGQVETR